MSRSSTAIVCDGLSKHFYLNGHAGTRSPLAGVKSAFARALGLPRAVPAEPEGLWALDNISFKVAPGEVVGIIGRNGAGKSTLLRILSKITKPTRGEARIWGRVGSLLEVGTGFHTELSGRENVYLNGAVLGMTRDEVRRRFDEIVAFAEVERFIDMPVKHYSSGMTVRLAFSVAAHLDPDILILDEVLAVGDAGFQKKCLQRMKSDTLQGRTVLFVSHSLPSVLAFCSRCLWLDHGRLVDDDEPKEVTARYLEAVVKQESGKSSPAMSRPITSEAALIGAPPEIADAIRRGERFGDGTARITAVRVGVHEPVNKSAEFIQTGDDIAIELDIVAEGAVVDARVAAIVYDPLGNRVIDANTEMKGELLQLRPGEAARVRFVLHNVLLKPDTYRVSTGIARRSIVNYDGIPSAATFEVHLNPALSEGFQIYPAVYQCRFSHEISTAHLA